MILVQRYSKNFSVTNHLFRFWKKYNTNKHLLELMLPMTNTKKQVQLELFISASDLDSRVSFAAKDLKDLIYATNTSGGCDAKHSLKRTRLQTMSYINPIDQTPSV